VSLDILSATVITRTSLPVTPPLYPSSTVLVTTPWRSSWYHQACGCEICSCLHCCTSLGTCPWPLQATRCLQCCLGETKLFHTLGGCHEGLWKLHLHCSGWQTMI